jgi:hypothetical protein
MLKVLDIWGGGGMGLTTQLAAQKAPDPWGIDWGPQPYDSVRPCGVFPVCGGSPTRQRYMLAAKGRSPVL